MLHVDPEKNDYPAPSPTSLLVPVVLPRVGRMCEAVLVQKPAKGFCGGYIGFRVQGLGFRIRV